MHTFKELLSFFKNEKRQDKIWELKKPEKGDFWFPAKKQTLWSRCKCNLVKYILNKLDIRPNGFDS